MKHAFKNCLCTPDDVLKMYPILNESIHCHYCQSKILQIQNLLQNLECHIWPKLSFPEWRGPHGRTYCKIEQQLKKTYTKLHVSQIACIMPHLFELKVYTQIGGKIFNLIIVNPRYNRYKICYKTWNFTLDQSWIAQNNVILIRVCCVRLSHNCKKKIRKQLIFQGSDTKIAWVPFLNLTFSIWIPLLFDGKYSIASLSIQDTTDTKSATKLGISHLSKAELPKMT